MKLAMGCDEAAYDLKMIIKKHLLAAGHEITDLGCHDGAAVLYPNIAFAVAQEITEGRVQRAILLCGTGIGMAISANKVTGIRAAQCHDTYSAERASRSNDAQIITIGARVVGPELAKAIVDKFLVSSFDGGNSQPKVDLITQYESKNVAAQ